MTRPEPARVLVYGRYHTTSYIMIHVLERLLAHEPRLSGVHLQLLLDDRRDVPLARSRLPASVEVTAQYEALQLLRAPRSWPEATIGRWERMYGSPHLRAFIESERALQGRPEAMKWDYLYSHIDYFERLWQRTQPDLFVSGAADGLNPWVAMSVFKANGVECLSFSPARFGQRSFILDNPYETLDIETAYRAVLARGLTAGEHAAAAALRDEYVSKRLKPTDHLAVRQQRRRRLPSLLTPIRLARETYTTDSGKFDLPLSIALARAARARTSGLRNRLLRRHVQPSLPPGERFFFFPLQYEPEISLSTQGRGWTDQLALAELISQSLPIDRWLYVKEHPSMLSGIRPSGFYRALMHLPRVRLLEQYMNSYDIIPRAEGVLTITGTAGWEALMLGRPVVLFGHAFYEEFAEGVTRLNRFDELPGILRDLRHRQVPEEPLLAYIATVLSRAPEGIFIEPRAFSGIADMVLSDANLDGIGSVIAQRLERMSAAELRHSPPQ